MNRSLLFCSFIFFHLLHADAQQQQFLIDSAFKSIDAKNYGRAITIYNSILKTDSVNARVYELRGLAYEEMKDYDNAGRDYTYSIRSNPEYWLAYLRRADLFSKMEYYDYALKDYTDAFSLADSVSRKVVILVNRAEVKRRMQNTTGAESDLRKALQYDPLSIAALVNLGALLPDIGKPAEAIQCLEKVIRLDSTFEGGYGNLAFLYMEQGEYTKALEISNKMLFMHPAEPYALNNRGFIKMKMNDLEGALEDINNSIQLLPDNSYAFKNRGQVNLALKKNKEACSDFQKALNLGFTKYFGNEVQRLMDTHCTKSAASIKIQ